MVVDLQKEQQASLARPRCRYSLAAKFFFMSMDLLAGKKTTLAKLKFLEMLAGIPYRAWERRQTAFMMRHHGDPVLEKRARDIIAWSRAAQDNEHWHLRVIHEKMKEDGCRDPWYLAGALTFLAANFYALFSRLLARLALRRAFLFNAEFEDHAEHVYAHFVQEHPEWEQQPLANERVKVYADVPTWADVFRRIGLDEREHMNRSLVHGSHPQRVAE
jgi:demethoxyubiquinone hydroxylase (CLK1/Coq7/Cat5 family)